jgi:hypothetical protein
MFEQVNKNVPGKIVALKISLEITQKDFDNICRIMESAIKNHGKIRLLLVVEHYASFFSAESLYEDLKFTHLYSNSIERMAVVGNQTWKSTWVALFGLFSGFLTNYYDKTEINEAWNWLQQH